MLSTSVVGCDMDESVVTACTDSASTTAATNPQHTSCSLKSLGRISTNESVAGTVTTIEDDCSFMSNVHSDLSSRGTSGSSPASRQVKVFKLTNRNSGNSFVALDDVALEENDTQDEKKEEIGMDQVDLGGTPAASTSTKRSNRNPSDHTLDMAEDIENSTGDLLSDDSESESTNECQKKIATTPIAKPSGIRRTNTDGSASSSYSASSHNTGKARFSASPKRRATRGFAAAQQHIHRGSRTLSGPSSLRSWTTKKRMGGGGVDLISDSEHSCRSTHSSASEHSQAAGGAAANAKLGGTARNVCAAPQRPMRLRRAKSHSSSHEPPTNMRSYMQRTSSFSRKSQSPTNSGDSSPTPNLRSHMQRASSFSRRSHSPTPTKSESAGNNNNNNNMRSYMQRASSFRKKPALVSPKRQSQDRKTGLLGEMLDKNRKAKASGLYLDSGVNLLEDSDGENDADDDHTAAVNKQKDDDTVSVGSMHSRHSFIPFVNLQDSIINMDDDEDESVMMVKNLDTNGLVALDLGYNDTPRPRRRRSSLKDIFLGESSSDRRGPRGRRRSSIASRGGLKRSRSFDTAHNRYARKDRYKDLTMKVDNVQIRLTANNPWNTFTKNFGRFGKNLGVMADLMSGRREMEMARIDESSEGSNNLSEDSEEREMRQQSELHRQKQQEHELVTYLQNVSGQSRSLARNKAPAPPQAPKLKNLSAESRIMALKGQDNEPKSWQEQMKGWFQ